MHVDTLGPVILDIAGTELLSEEAEILKHPKVGGLILFSRNYESSEQLHALVTDIRSVRQNVVVCVDHEGGRVQRFKKDFTKLPPMQALGNQYRQSKVEAKALAVELGWLMAAELLAHDIDLSFAPVLDIDGGLSDIIGDRAFSSEAEDIIVLAAGFIDGMNQAGMAATGKHFPGHGGVKADSHLERPVDLRGIKALEARDLRPFKQLLHRLDAIMSAHIVFPEIDANLVSFSSYWLKTYLRKKLNYDGFIFSDDLSMEGAAGAGDYPERGRQALAAGCDALIVCNNPSGAVAILEALEGDAPGETCVGLGRLRGVRRLQKGELCESRRWKKAVAASQRLIR